MNKEMLLNELLAQATSETNINDEMQKEIDNANKLIVDVKNSWNDFIKEAFPEEIVSIMSRFDTNGRKLNNSNTLFHADSICPIISVGDLHIAFTHNSSRNLLFIQGNKVIGFRYYKKGSYEYSKYGMLTWESYPQTFWEYLPYKIDNKTSKQGMCDNRKTIDLVYDFNKMLTTFQDNLPKIYAEISRINAEYIQSKRDALSVTTKTNTQPKKYMITIEIEEI